MLLPYFQVAAVELPYFQVAEAVLLRVIPVGAVGEVLRFRAAAAVCYSWFQVAVVAAGAILRFPEGYSCTNQQKFVVAGIRSGSWFG